MPPKTPCISCALTTPTLRLDVADDRQQLQAKIAAVRPILLALAPFVHPHRIAPSGDSLRGFRPAARWVLSGSINGRLAILSVAFTSTRRSNGA
jgi:hypothetical protein